MTNIEVIGKRSPVISHLTSVNPKLNKEHRTLNVELRRFFVEYRSSVIGIPTQKITLQ